MPYTHIFEVLLLFALIIGICFGWKEPAKYKSRRAETPPAGEQAIPQ